MKKRGQIDFGNSFDSKVDNNAGIENNLSINNKSTKTNTIINNLVKKRKKIMIFSVIIAVTIVIVFLILIFIYLRSSVHELNLGASIENALISEDGKAVYIKLAGGSLNKNISKIKFVFTDENGNECYYETTEGIKEIEVPFKGSFWDWVFKRQFSGVYDYKISAEDTECDFNNINKVSVVFEYVTVNGQIIETPKLDTTKPTIPKASTGGGGGGGGGGQPPATCTSNCAGKECGDDGCGNSNGCGICSSGKVCSNGTCIDRNLKNMLKYSDRETFLISDRDWKEVLPLVPLSVWTGYENDCKRGTGTPSDVCIYPTLIYHSEDLLGYNIENPASSSQEGSWENKVYSYNGKSLVRFNLDEKSKKEFLRSDLDVASVGKNYVDVVLTEKEKSYYENAGYNMEIISITLPVFKEYGSSIDGYRTYNAVVSELNNLSIKYSDIAKVYEIGKSIEGRSILAIKISDNVESEENEKQILVVGNHHARELMTVEVPMYMVNYLLSNYETNTEIKKVVDNHELWFIPTVNPDGHVYVENGDIWWRKNRRDNGDGSFGVDLNRNYGYTWGYDNIGSSPYPSSDSYRGVSAFSEPETDAIRNFTVHHNISYVLDYHGSAGVILYPWGHIYEPTPDDSLFRNLSQDFLRFLPGFIAGQISDVMYFSNGDSVDWYYGDQENKTKIIGFGIELNPGEGFIPPKELIIPTSQEQLFVLLNLTGYPFKYSVSQKIDADSAVYFMQQYKGDLTIIGNTTTELDNLLVTQAPLGAGLTQNQIKKISPNDYFSYWDYYKDIVYVEDNYELSLMASTVASLINAPLVIKGTSSDSPTVFVGKNVICAGNVTPSAGCNQQYNLEQLRDKYLADTKTKKLILTNPDDLTISGKENLYPTRTSGPVTYLYGKTSLVSPFLASARHELILTDKSKDYKNISENIDNFFNKTYNEKTEKCGYSQNCSNGFANYPVDMVGAKNSITFFLAGKADVKIYSVYSSGQIIVDKENELTIDVANIGFDIAKDCVLEVYEINESSGGGGGGGFGGGGGGGGPEIPGIEFILIKRIDIGDINSDEIKDIAVNWTPTKIGGTTIYMNISTTSNESNIYNNEWYEYFYVTGPSPDIEVFVNAPGKLLVNAPNLINFSIKNIGTIISGDVNLTLYQDKWECNMTGCDRKRILIDNRILSPINPDETKEVSIGFTPDEARYYEFIVNAESPGDINDYNNERYFSLLASTLEPQIGYYFNIPEKMIINQNNQVNLTLYNTGFENAVNSVVEFYVQDMEGNKNLIERKNIGEINESEKKVSFNLIPNELGYHYLIFNLSYEYSKGSKSFESWYGVEFGLPGPDISAYYLYSYDVELGKENTAYIEMRNRGNENAQNVKYYFYDNNVLIKEESIGLLEPGRYLSKEILWTPVGTGNHRLNFNVTCDNDVNLEDNQYIRDIQVYNMKYVTFNIMNKTSGYISRYLGRGYNGNSPQTIDLISKPILQNIPDMPTDLWIIKSDWGMDNYAEYAATTFYNSNLRNTMTVTSEEYRNPRVEDEKRLYHIYYNKPGFSYSSASVKFNYPDYRNIGITNPENITVYYCENWDLDSETCLTTWQDAYPGWYTEGYSLYLEVYYESNLTEAFAVGEPIGGYFKSESKKIYKAFDFSRLQKDIEFKKRYVSKYIGGEYGGMNYQLYIPGFFYNCLIGKVNVYFNDSLVGEVDVECRNSIPSTEDEVSLGSYVASGVKNITLTIDGDIIFYNSSKLIKIYKNGEGWYFGEDISSGISSIEVNSFGSNDTSKFNFENENYSSFIVTGEGKNAPDLNVYLNEKLIGELDLTNSNGKKAREFRISDEFLGTRNLNVSLSSKSSGKLYLAEVNMKSNFDPYYLTIVASPDAIPIQDFNFYESDFRKYADINNDDEGEFSVGRIMGITSSDFSSYLARVFFYNDIKSQKGATIMIEGDGLYQGIPSRTCGTGFCKCYYDVECNELFSRYSGFFDTFETCNQDLINGTPQNSSNCIETERLQKSMFYNSSFVGYGGHAGPTGLGGVISTSQLKESLPQFDYAFGCASCSYGYVKADLFCTNMIRKGSIGYQGSVENMYGNHLIDEIMDELLINNKSIGYAFKIGKNKEQRYDWKTPNLQDCIYLRDEYGVYDVLIGDPSFDGGIGK